MNARRVLQILLFGLGAAAVGIGVMHMLLGPAIIPGSIPVNATLDSEDRFFGAIFAGFGAAALWCSFGVERKLTEVMLVAALFYLGGVARLFSIAATGLPDPFFIAMTAVELLLPRVLVWLVARVAGPAFESADDALTA